MRKFIPSILLFQIIFIFGAFVSFAQYSTPGTGVQWKFSDLVTHSSSAVTGSGTTFTITQNVTVSPTDKLTVDADITVKFNADIQLIIGGSGASFIVNAPTQAIFTASNTASLYDVIQFETGSIVNVNNALFEYGKGIRCIETDAVFNNSTIQEMGYTTNTAGAISATRGKITIDNCRFLNNQRSAISSGANMGSTFIIRNSCFYNNTLDNSNRPQINIGPCQEGDTTKIIGNTVIGVDKDKVGGISCSSLLGVATVYRVEDNDVKNNRFGLTMTGSNIIGFILGNKFIDNNLETNPMMGGSGINITAAAGNTHVEISRNEISGNLWGITLVGNTTNYTVGPTCNMGNLEPGDNFNEGRNVFSNNGNGGNFYDLYNNNPNDVMAQNNTWGVDEQIEEKIESVVSHKIDDPRYGLVTFMPPYIEPYHCAVPQNFTHTVDSSTVKLLWNTPENKEVTSYNIYCNDVLLTSVTDTFYTQTDLANGTYHYCVTAVYADICESESVCKDVIVAVIICDPPTNLEYEVTYYFEMDTNIRITWEAPKNEEVLSYNFYRNDVFLKNVSDTFYIDIHVPGNTRKYCITAVYEDCESDSICTNVDMPIAVHEKSADAIVVAPNPAHTSTTVTGKNLERIEIYNNLGILVKTISVQQKTSVSVYVTDYPPGVYLFKVINTDKKSTSIKVVR